MNQTRLPLPAVRGEGRGEGLILPQPLILKLILTLILTLTLTACDSTPRPEEPIWGKQPCAHCAMLLSERALAAQALFEDGCCKFFDDVGCLVAWQDREHPRLKAQWVRGPNAEGWVDPTTAKFSSGHPTPMDFGFLASNEGVTFDEVREAVRNKTRKLP